MTNDTYIAKLITTSFVIVNSLKKKIRFENKKRRKRKTFNMLQLKIEFIRIKTERQKNTADLNINFTIP